MQRVKDYCSGLGLWLQNMPMCFRLYLIFSLLLQLLCLFTSKLNAVMIFSVENVVEQYQFWRLATSFMVGMPFNFYGMMVFILSFWTLSITMPELVQFCLIIGKQVLHDLRLGWVHQTNLPHESSSDSLHLPLDHFEFCRGRCNCYRRHSFHHAHLSVHEHMQQPWWKLLHLWLYLLLDEAILAYLCVAGTDDDLS